MSTYKTLDRTARGFVLCMVYLDKHYVGFPLYFVCMVGLFCWCQSRQALALVTLWQLTKWQLMLICHFIYMANLFPFKHHKKNTFVLAILVVWQTGGLGRPHSLDHRDLSLDQTFLQLRPRLAQPAALTAWRRGLRQQYSGTGGSETGGPGRTKWCGGRSTGKCVCIIGL